MPQGWLTLRHVHLFAIDHFNRYEATVFVTVGGTTPIFKFVIDLRGRR
jgi:hypothetical protein